MVRVEKRRVLFLCTHNSARSQMAEALLRHLFGKRYDSFSAGATPTKVHPLAVKAVSEIGIDASNQFSKSIESYQGEDFDLVVTVCKSTPKIACPFCSTPGTFGSPNIIKDTLPSAKHFLEHGFNDPSDVEGSEEERLEAFRKTRDEIKAWIQDYFS
jgi:arsenate reductase